MKVLLIDPPGWQKHSLNLGLAYLAGALRAAGFDIRILDMNNHDYSESRINKIIIDFGPSVIGISVKTATANVSADIVRRLKGVFPDIVYVAGGPHITLCGQEFIGENREIDVGVLGEGENSFVQLLRHIKANKKDISEIGGICHRQNGRIVCNDGYEQPDISKVALPVFEYAMDMDFTDFRYPLLTSRGCPYGCIFCCVGLISGKKWRGRQPEDVVHELEHAKDNYQMQSFEIMDDNFTLDVSRAKKICRLMIKKRLNLSWWCHNGLRADRLDRELLGLMKKAGCTSIALGIESGDKAVFNGISKGEELSDIVRAVQMVKKAGIRCVGYFIVGLPGDSIDSTKRSVRFQRGLGLSDHKYNMLVPYPGTKIWDMVKEKGTLLTDIKGVYHFGDNIKIPFETDKLSKKTLEQCMYLVENQDWVHGETDIRGIRLDFNARVGRDINKTVVIENEANLLGKYIEIEWEKTGVLKMLNAQISDEVKDKCLIESDGDGSYFNSLCTLMQKEGYRAIFDMSRRRLLLQRIRKAENEFIRGEILPPASQWDNSPGKYLACRLKHSSPDICSGKNGVIYKDNIALPFSHTPGWDKTPSGKVESGLAFISKTALNPDSTYTADYLAIKKDSSYLELIISGNKESSLDRILSESDISFYPEVPGYLPPVFPGAKMSVVYYDDWRGAGSRVYRVCDMLSGVRSDHGMRKAMSVLSLQRKIKPYAERSLTVVCKGSKVAVLWAQILTDRMLIRIKSFISGIVKS